jgi:hypothetical protein
VLVIVVEVGRHQPRNMFTGVSLRPHGCLSKVEAVTDSLLPEVHLLR